MTTVGPPGLRPLAGLTAVVVVAHLLAWNRRNRVVATVVAHLLVLQQA